MSRIPAVAVPFVLALAATAVATFATCGSDEAGTTSQQGGTRGAAAVTALGERVRLLVSGSMEGRLEPCGCAQGQLGGLARRMTHIQEQQHNYDLLLEGGDLVQENTAIDLEKAFAAIEVLFGMRRPYDALGLGPRDLTLPFDDWTGYLTAYNVPLLASDLQSSGGAWPGRAFVEKEVRATKVRIAALVLQLPARDAGAKELPLQLLAPAAAWERALQGAAPDTLRILMVHGGPERVRELAATLQPRPDLVIGVGDTYHEPPGSPETVAGVPVVFPGIRGRLLLDLTLARAPDGPRLLQYEIVPLRGSDSKRDAGQDPDVRLMLRKHREFVKESGVLAAMAGTLPAPDGLTYVGSAACQGCHPNDYAVWERSKHAAAWATLERAEQDADRYGWPVTHYPDCVSCHVVGYRQQGGFVTHADTPHLSAVGCERCHGPGSAHAADPMRKMGPVGAGAPSLVCVQCHDFEQSPDFDYEKRWRLIQHGPMK